MYDNQTGKSRTERVELMSDGGEGDWGEGGRGNQ